jgi:hypothetical protein
MLKIVECFMAAPVLLLNSSRGYDAAIKKVAMDYGILATWPSRVYRLPVESKAAGGWRPCPGKSASDLFQHQATDGVASPKGADNLAVAGLECI